MIIDTGDATPAAPPYEFFWRAGDGTLDVAAGRALDKLDLERWLRLTPREAFDGSKLDDVLVVLRNQGSDQRLSWSDATPRLGTASRKNPLFHWRVLPFVEARSRLLDPAPAPNPEPKKPGIPVHLNVFLAVPCSASQVRVAVIERSLDEGYRSALFAVRSLDSIFGRRSAAEIQARRTANV